MLSALAQMQEVDNEPPWLQGRRQAQWHKGSICIMRKSLLEPGVVLGEGGGGVASHVWSYPCGQGA